MKNKKKTVSVTVTFELDDSLDVANFSENIDSLNTQIQEAALDYALEALPAIADVPMVVNVVLTSGTHERRAHGLHFECAARRLEKKFCPPVYASPLGYHQHLRVR